MPGQAFVFILYLQSEHGIKTRKDGALALSFLHSPPLPLKTFLTALYGVCVCVRARTLLVLKNPLKKYIKRGNLVKAI